MGRLAKSNIVRVVNPRSRTDLHPKAHYVVADVRPATPEDVIVLHGVNGAVMASQVEQVPDSEFQWFRPYSEMQ